MRIPLLACLLLGSFPDLPARLAAQAAPAVQGAPAATTGRVVDEAGQPLPGVVVRVIRRPRITTSTDEKGRFWLRRPARRDSLVLTLPGYQTARVLVQDGQTIALREDTVVTEQLRDLLRRGKTY